jgi:hypothetical protein
MLRLSVIDLEVPIFPSLQEAPRVLAFGDLVDILDGWRVLPKEGAIDGSAALRLLGLGMEALLGLGMGLLPGSGWRIGLLLGR